MTVLTQPVGPTIIVVPKTYVMKATTAQFAQMHSQMRKPYIEWDRRVQVKGLDVRLTSVARARREQIALYAQGREPLDHVNMYRKIAGLQPIDEADNMRKVTYTLNSDHVIDLDDGDPDNDYARALDFVVMNAKHQCVWDLKADVNFDSLPDYQEIAIIGRDCGFDPGFFWKQQDPPHMSYKLKKVVV